MRRAGYTLLELLITVGVIATLFTIVVEVLNPVELLAEGRDSRRMSEVTSLDKAIAFATAQNLGIYQGDPNTVYLSLPNTTGGISPDYLGSCPEYSSFLPPLISPWKYSCANKTSYRKTDGTGWIPINFKTLPVVPINDLTPDPTNDASKGLYYDYVSGWEINAQMESNKYQWGGNSDRESTDGGDTILLYEKGNQFTFMPPEVQARFDTPVQVPTSCSDTLNPLNSGQNYEIYDRWTVPGNEKGAATKLWYWQGCDSNPCPWFNKLETGEFLRLALYEDNPSSPVSNAGRRISDIVSVQGDLTGSGGPFSKWYSAALPSPVPINLGSTYIVGIGQGGSTGNGYSVPYEITGGCANYLPNGSTSVSYVATANGTLGSVVEGYGPSSRQAGIIGISYAKN